MEMAVISVQKLNILSTFQNNIRMYKPMLQVLPMGV